MSESDDSDLVWVHAHVEPMSESDEYHSIPRAEWEAMTPDQQDRYRSDSAIDAMNNAGGCGAVVVDREDVPAEYLECRR
jgi:hypothetical protein